MKSTYYNSQNDELAYVVEKKFVDQLGCFSVSLPEYRLCYRVDEREGGEGIGEMWWG